MTKRFFIFIVTINNVLIAQLDSSKLLNEISFSTKIKMDAASVGSILTNISDKQLRKYNSQSILNVLSAESGAYIKSYGLMGTSSISLRGTGAAQTLVLWNGFPLESITIGITEFNVLENSLANNIVVQNGGNSALWGSSAIGGTVYFNTSEKKDSCFHLNSNSLYGSFNSKFQSLNLMYCNKKWSTQTKIFYKSADNNFTFYNTAKREKPLDTLKNSEYLQYGIITENYFIINSKIKIISRIWYQNAFRKLQPSMLAYNYVDTLQDKNFKSTLEFYHEINNSYKYQIKFAWFNDNLIYASNSINSINNTNRFILEIDNKYKISLLQDLNFGFYFNKNIASVINYNGIVNIEKIAGFISYTKKQIKNKYLFNISFREEFQNNQFAFTSKIGGEIKLIQNINLLFNASKNFRFPTFNDLFWKPGGNPNLLPETSYNQEISLKGNNDFNKNIVNWHVTFYNNFISNCITWTPNINGYYSPNNLDLVWARGLETKIENSFTKKDFILNFKNNFFYNLSTNENLNGNDKYSYKKQLIYIPILKIINSFSTTYKYFNFNITHQYIGDRFITSDNTQFLPFYNLINLYISQQFNFKKYNFIIHFQVDNIFNESYQSISYYAQPLRNFKTGLQFYF